MARHFFLLKELVKRDFQGRYAGSLLGFVWSLVQPLWLLALFTFVFATVMKVHPAGTRTDSFAVFLFAGLAPWMAIHEGVVRGATAITDNAQLVKKLSFPSELLVLTVVLVALLHQAIALGIFVVVLAFLGELSPATLPLLALAVPLQVAITLGLGLLVASAQVFFRDTSQVLGLALQGWFYLTPIVYPLAWVPERFRAVLELNPLTPLVDLYRQSLLGPDLAPPPAVVGLAATAAVALADGLWVFRRVKPAFVDEI